MLINDDRYMDLLDRSFHGEVFHSNELAELRRGTETNFGPNREFATAVVQLRDAGVPIEDAQWAVGQATIRRQNGDRFELIAIAKEVLRREDLAA